MKELINIIQENYSLEDIESIEKNDPMFHALEQLFQNIENKEMFLPVIIANAIVCYQLSSIGEVYWEEFGTEASKYEFHKLKDVYLFFVDFLPKSEGNRRLVNTKIERLKKLDHFLSDFFFKQKFYYKNMLKFREDIGKYMRQTEDAKTIVFSVKMFGYGARIRFGQFISFPKEIPIPIDSRLQSLYKGFKQENSTDIASFYKDLCEGLDIAPLHMDAILWLNHTALLELSPKKIEAEQQSIGFDEA